MVQLRTMTAADFPLVMRLVEQAGWNQTLADCRRFVELQPDGCFVAERDGQAVGTTATCRFGSVAWIAMVLVDPPFRQQGIGTQLVTHALSYLDHHQVQSVRLDATELGRPLYERLGFSVEYEVDRFVGRGGEGGIATEPSRATRRHFAGIIRFDQQVTGTDRTRLLTRLLDENPNDARIAVQAGKVLGYAMRRPGRCATQIGPIAAITPVAGRQLLEWAVRRGCRDTVFVDLPRTNQAAAACAVARGFAIQRTFARLVRGPSVQDRPHQIWASSGPELG